MIFFKITVGRQYGKWAKARTAHTGINNGYSSKFTYIYVFYCVIINVFGLASLFFSLLLQFKY